MTEPTDTNPSHLNCYRGWLASGYKLTRILDTTKPPVMIWRKEIGRGDDDVVVTDLRGYAFALLRGQGWRVALTHGAIVAVCTATDHPATSTQVEQEIVEWPGDESDEGNGRRARLFHITTGGQEVTVCASSIPCVGPDANGCFDGDCRACKGRGYVYLESNDPDDVRRHIAALDDLHRAS
jgi:hypothetical protein